MKEITLIGLLVLLNSSLITPQSDSLESSLNEIIETVITENEDDIEDDNLITVVEDLLLNPININEADSSQLLQIPYLDPFSVHLILHHRSLYGVFFSVSELYSIKDLDQNIISSVLPFITVFVEEQNYADDNTLSNFPYSIITNSKFLLRSRVSSDLQDRSGFTKNKYAGSKLKTYNRLVIKNSNNIQAGVLFEKDAGEKSLNDFTSYYVQLKNFSVLKNIVAGDYTLEFGQGLAMWSPFGFSKGSDAVIPVKKKARNISPYTSSAEYGYLRGLAANIYLDKLSLTGYYSSRLIDASIDSIADKITSINLTGFHRTQNELLRQNAVKQKLIGIAIEYRFSDRLNIGLVHYKTTFSKKFYATDLYDPENDSYNYSSVYYDANLSSINIFGEAVYNEKSVASINGLELLISKQLTYVTSIRSYPSNYNNLFGFGFSERNGKIKNEVGLYSGFKYKTKPGIFNFYFDIFKYPYASYESSLPAEGYELLFDFSSRVTPKSEIKLRYKYENKEVEKLIDEKYQITNRLRQNFRCEFLYDFSNKFRYRSRLEYNYFFIKNTSSRENGFLVLQDLRFKSKNNLFLSGRVILFQTDSFNSAVYEFENDLVGVMPNIAMYGKGFRWYLIAGYTPFNNLTISAKYSETYKPDATSLSSGDNEIFGNLDNRFSLQIDLSF